MRTVLSLTLFAVFILSSSAATVWGCTISGRSLQKFDSTEYVFIGEVVGFTGPVAFDALKPLREVNALSSTDVGTWPNARKTVGIKVRLTDTVYVPKKPSEFFEIYVYGLGADCSTRGSNLANLKKEFPVGSEVRIISREAIFLTESAKPGIIQLEDRPGDGGSIALNKLQDGTRMTTATSTFDYKSYRYDVDRDSPSTYLLPSFEARKDLVRLESLRSPAERRLVLLRLFDLPRQAHIDLKEVIDAYSDNQEAADQLYDSYLMASDPELYKLYQVLRRVTSELIRLGFNRNEADYAIRKAMASGTKVEFDVLVKETVRILKNP